MKKIREDLTENEFGEYLEDIRTEMESETTYFGQQDEYVPYYGDLQRCHIYGEEKDEHKVVLYVAKYNEETGEITYDIYDELG